MQQSSDSPGVVVFPPLLFVGTYLVGLLLHWIYPLPLFGTSDLRLVGWGVFALAALLAGAAQRAMRRAGTNIRPDKPALALVTDGPFRFTRNPLYLAATGLYIGIAVALNMLWPLLLLFPMFALLSWGVVQREERYLEAKFGESYLTYKAHVRRWL